MWQRDTAGPSVSTLPRRPQRRRQCGRRQALSWLVQRVSRESVRSRRRALSLAAPLDMLRQLISTTRPQGEVTFVGEARLATQLKRWRGKICKHPQTTGKKRDVRPCQVTVPAPTRGVKQTSRHEHEVRRACSTGNVSCMAGHVGHQGHDARHGLRAWIDASVAGTSRAETAPCASPWDRHVHGGQADFRHAPSAWIVTHLASTLNIPNRKCGIRSRPGSSRAWSEWVRGAKSVGLGVELQAGL